MPPKKRPQKQAAPQTAGKRTKTETSSSALPLAPQGSTDAPQAQQPAATASAPPLPPPIQIPSTASTATTAKAATSPGLLVLSAADVQRCLARMDASDICDGQAEVFRAIYEKNLRRRQIEVQKQMGNLEEAGRMEASAAAMAPRLQIPQRLAVDMKKHTALFMPSRVGQDTACKIVGVPKPTTANTTGRGSSAADAGIPGSTILLDAQTAKVKAIVDSTALTALRTAAGSVLATQISHPVRSWERGEDLRVVIFGGGRQAYYHAWMLHQNYLEVELGYPQLTHLAFVTRRPLDQTALPQLAREMPEGQPREGDPEDVVRIDDLVAEGVTSADEAAVARLVRQADIICCCTPSTEPLFRYKDVKRGAQINLVGSYKPHMQEVEPDLIRAAARSYLVVDSLEACAHEAGDIIKAGIVLHNFDEEDYSMIMELGDALDGTMMSPGSCDSECSSCWSERHRDSDFSKSSIYVFKSVGVGAQDVRIAEDIYDEATREGRPLIGTRVPY